MKTQLNREKLVYVKKVMLIVALSGIIFLYLNKRFSFYIPCIFNKITHLYCPGCGITRMILSMFKLDFYQAFRYNPLLFILFPFFVIYFAFYFYYWIHDKHLVIPKKYWYILLVITIIFTILRNTSEFSYLAPTVIKK